MDLEKILPRHVDRRKELATKLKFDRGIHLAP